MRPSARALRVHRTAACGFTLVEMMIAIAIMALLSLMAWRSLDSMGRTQARLAEHADRTTALTRTLQQFEQDLAWRASTEWPVAVQAQPPDRARLPADLSVQRTAQTPWLIEWVRCAPAEPGKWMRVRWWWRGGVLYRAAGTPASTYPLPPPLPAQAEVVLRDVVGVETRIRAAHGDWLPLMGTAAAPAAPAGLALTLRLQRRETPQRDRDPGPVRSYQLVIALN